MNKKYFLAAVVLFASAFSYADFYYHPVTGDLVVDEGSFVFSSSCSDTRVFIGDKGIYIAYESMLIDGRGSKTCYIRFDIKVPEGWYAAIESDAAISGSYLGSGVVTLEQTLAGVTSTPSIEYLDGSGGYSLDQQRDTVAQTTCGADTQLKTLVSITSFFPDGYINLTSGSIGFRFVWFQC